MIAYIYLSLVELDETSEDESITHSFQLADLLIFLTGFQFCHVLYQPKMCVLKLLNGVLGTVIYNNLKE